VFCGLGHRLGEADALGNLGITQRDLGDYPAAAASLTRSLMLFRDGGNRVGQTWVLNDLGLLQQLTGDYPAAAASHQQALGFHRDLGNLAGVADALNNLGGLSSRTSATRQARDHHNQALVLARDIGVPLEEARALEGIGHSHLQDGHPGKGLTCLRQALGIYQRIGSLRAQHVQETLRQYGQEPAALTPPAT
jgi:tetratricopeptide (TPR) repeat protein